MVNKKAAINDIINRRGMAWKMDPVLFCEEVLSFTPDAWQAEVLRYITGHSRIAVKSGQGVGKTGLEACALLWFLICYPYSRVVATAPTRQQLNDVLWSEASKWMNKSPLLTEFMRWTKTYIYVRGHEKRWFAAAKTATKPENMQGFHEDNMLFIVDEASGVADPIMEAILGTLSGRNNRILLMGNPTRTSGTFFDAFHSDIGLYKVKTVTARNSPRTSKDNIASLEKKYGKDSNVVRVRVDGEFPEQEDDVFISYQAIEAAAASEPMNEPVSRIAFGVDVARYGDDETVIMRNIGGNITMPAAFRGKSLMKTAGELVRLYREAITELPDYEGFIYINIDDTGLGGGVTDRLEEVKREEALDRMVIVPVNAASRVPDDVVETGAGRIPAKELYDNMTTYMWAGIKDGMEQGRLSLSRVARDSELIGQISCRKYYLTSRGKIALETKDDMKKRGISSPDRADALALSLYEKKVFDVRNLVR